MGLLGRQGCQNLAGQGLIQDRLLSEEMDYWKMSPHLVWRLPPLPALSHLPKHTSPQIIGASH